MTDPHAPETFESWDSYWQFRFESSRRTRFIRSEKSERFLRAVADTCADRAVELKKDRIFWRAQLGHDWQLEEQISEEIPAPFGKARMKPLPDRAHEGRVNPRGCRAFTLQQRAKPLCPRSGRGSGRLSPSPNFGWNALYRSLTAP